MTSRLFGLGILVLEASPRPIGWGGGGKNFKNDLDVIVRRCQFERGELNLLYMNERRRVPRYSAHVSASVKLPGADTDQAVLVEDLCILGCKLESCPKLEVRQECQFALSWKGREFQTPAVVAWKGEHGQVGLEFVNTPPANLQMLREICAGFVMKPLVRLSKDPF